ncbi:MAG: hypothetical protein V4773_10665 [Verrucomicrobiota bacterium]
MPRFLPIFALFLTLFAAGRAQEVEVTTVRFTNLRAPTGSNGTWLEANIQLTVRPAPSAPRDIVSRVRVSLLVGFDLPASAGGERRIEHYRAEAECVALEAGRADVRFYLPPELVKRDQLHGDPKYWGVELAVAGKAVPAAKGAYSPALGNAEQRKNFQTRGGSAAASNDGLLQPQFLTPFVNEYPRATPTFVRREGR